MNYIHDILAPSPTITHQYTAKTCKAKDNGKLKQWYEYDHCQHVDIEHIPEESNGDEIVFTVRFPAHKDIQLSRWNQYVLILMSVEFKRDKSDRKMGRYLLTIPQLLKLRLRFLCTSTYNNDILVILS